MSTNQQDKEVKAKREYHEYHASYVGHVATYMQRGTKRQCGGLNRLVQGEACLQESTNTLYPPLNWIPTPHGMTGVYVCVCVCVCVCVLSMCACSDWLSGIFWQNPDGLTHHGTIVIKRFFHLVISMSSYYAFCWCYH